MAVLRESPWYQEILKEGVEQGLQQGLQQGAQRHLVLMLQLRFGTVPGEVQTRLAGLSVEQLEALMAVALTVESLEEFVSRLVFDEHQ